MISSHTTKRFQTLHSSSIELGWELDPRFEMKCTFSLFLFAFLISMLCAVHNLHAFACACFSGIAQSQKLDILYSFRSQSHQCDFNALPSRPNSFHPLSFFPFLRHFCYSNMTGAIHDFTNGFFFSLFCFFSLAMYICETSVCNQNALWQREQHSNRLEHFWLEWFDQCCCECLSVQTMRK